MGINIRRCLGYGLKGLRQSKKTGRLSDHRINRNGYLCANYSERKKRWTQAGYLAFCEERMRDISFKLLKSQFDPAIKEKPSKLDFDRCLHVGDTDYGILGALLLQEPRWKDWTRFDNIIDYCEWNMKYRSCKDDWLWLDFPIYPHYGYMDSETGERLVEDSPYDDNTAVLVREMWFNLRSAQDPDGNPKRKKDHMYLARFAAKKLGLTLNEAKRRYTPIIPDTIEMMARYLELFTDESVIWQLRPAIYTYWA